MPIETTVLQERLETLLGAAQVLAGVAHTAAFAVDGVLPELVASPGTQEELAQVVAACHGAGAAMIPWGGGTAMGLGNAPARAEVVICLHRLDRVVEWDPANLTVTVEAGMRLAALQELVGRERTVLPLDPPAGRQVTVGGLVAANQSGPGRLLYGTVRDWVLGLRVVLPDGERIHCGGRVIKNVSGYDMNKLFIRSLGTLGIVSEVTFKLLPMPARRAGVIATFPDAASAWAAVQRTRDSFLLPEAMDFLNPEAVAQLAPELGLAQAPACAVVVAVAGSAETVARQVRDFLALFRDCGGAPVELAEAESARAWQAVRDEPEAAPGGRGSRILCRIAVPISRTAELVAAAEALARACGLAGTVLAHAGSGIVRAGFSPGAGAAPAPAVAEALAALRGLTEAAGGSLVLQDAPAAVKARLDAWGGPFGGLAVMQRLKQEMDPLALCNPGRFPGGI